MLDNAGDSGEFNVAAVFDFKTLTPTPLPLDATHDWALKANCSELIERIYVTD